MVKDDRIMGAWYSKGCSISQWGESVPWRENFGSIAPGYDEFQYIFRARLYAEGLKVNTEVMG